MPIIYKIWNSQGCYYGSSRLSLEQRINQHYWDLRKYRNGKHGRVMCFDLVDDVEDLNWNTFNNAIKYEVVEEVENECLLLEREKHYILNNRCINLHVPLRKRGDKRVY